MTVQVPAYTLDTLNGNEAISIALLVAFAVGVGVGSLLCERMSGHRIELGLVPFGSIGLSVFAIDLYFAQTLPHVGHVTSVSEFLARPGSLRVLFDLAMLGAFAGFYSVPLYALVQKRAKREYLSRVIAANNILNTVFMVVASFAGHHRVESRFFDSRTIPDRRGLERRSRHLHLFLAAGIHDAIPGVGVDQRPLPYSTQGPRKRPA